MVVAGFAWPRRTYATTMSPSTVKDGSSSSRVDEPTTVDIIHKSFKGINRGREEEEKNKKERKQRNNKKRASSKTMNGKDDPPPSSVAEPTRRELFHKTLRGVDN